MRIKVKNIVILRFWGWYYTQAVKGLIKIWRNFIIFVEEYYSIPLLIKTLFHPWRRDITKYGRGFSFKKFFETLSFNLISRSIGFSARITIIIIGVLCLVGIMVSGFLALIIWIILPLVLLVFIMVGFLLIAGLL